MAWALASQAASASPERVVNEVCVGHRASQRGVGHMRGVGGIGWDDSEVDQKLVVYVKREGLWGVDPEPLDEISQGSHLMGGQGADTPEETRTIYPKVGRRVLVLDGVPHLELHVPRVLCHVAP